MKILVIGGTGNIGLPLIQYLDQQVGVQVVAGAHNLHKDEQLLAAYPDVEIRRFDFWMKRPLMRRYTVFKRSFSCGHHSSLNPSKICGLFSNACKHTTLSRSYLFR
ncbi:hypothetical protein AGMB00912_02769 [Lactiplantibacillus argentoratensis]